jgi:hypothetical protein
MRRAVVLLAVLLFVGALIAGPGTPSNTTGRQLEGKVGPGFTISLTQDGQAITSLRPGTYWLTVEDLSSIHNFHILGADLDMRVTSVPFIGTVTVKLLLEAGTVTFQCDPHADTMRGTFEVGGVGQVD